MLCWHSTGSGKCHARGTPILMYDGSRKQVQDVVEGDVLMGDDSLPRTVLRLGSGIDDMYRVVQERNGEPYVVNSEHVLTLTDASGERTLDVELPEYLAWSQDERDRWFGFQTAVDFPATSHAVSDDIRSPYMMGFSTTQGRVPREYLIGDRVTRAALLDGMIDAYGKVDDAAATTTLFVSCPELRDDVAFLCRALGHATRVQSDASTVVISKSAGTGDRVTTPIRVEKTGERDTYYGFTLDGNHRYLLGDCTVTHNTCTAAGIMDAMWDSNRMIIYLTSIEGLASNPPFKFQSCMSQMYERFHGMSPETLDKAFRQRGIQFLSFSKMAHRIKKSEEALNHLGIGPGDADPTAEFFGNPVDYISSVYGIGNRERIARVLTEHRVRSWDTFVDINNSMLVVDEVHNLFKPSYAHQKKDHDYLKKHLIAEGKRESKKYSHPDAKIAILTATPGDTIAKTIALLNLVKSSDAPEIAAPDLSGDPADVETRLTAFKRSIAGLVSYFDMNNDPGRVPRTVMLEPQRMPMSKTQFEGYLRAYADSEKTQSTKNMEATLRLILDPKVTNKPAFPEHNELNKYYALARKYSNMLFKFEPRMQLEEVSSKLPALLNNVVEKYADQKHYVYSSFYENRGSSHGILEIGRQLTKLGYKQLLPGDTKKNLAPAKRFIVLTTIATDKSDAVTHRLLNIFNSDANKNGEIAQVILASQKFNEGLDLKAVRHIHMFEPLVTMAAETQTIGRARRNCSHAQLPYDEWTVTVHRYMSDFPISVRSSADSGETDETRLAVLEARLEANKKDKALAKDLRAEIRKLKASIKSGAGAPRNIDDVISALAKNNLQGVTMIHHAMKEASIECNLLAEYHDDPSIKCAFGAT